jgi:hypothetical protein
MEIDESDKQQGNADSSIDKSREPEANVTTQTDMHPPKRCLASCSTEDGMPIDEIVEQNENADSFIHAS